METLTLPAWLEIRQILAYPSGHYDGQNLMPSRDLKVANTMNDPGSQGGVCVFGPGFTEEIGSLTRVEISPVTDNCGHSSLICKERR